MGITRKYVRNAFPKESPALAWSATLFAVLLFVAFPISVEQQ
jgi:hypothetical protein